MTIALILITLALAVWLIRQWLCAELEPQQPHLPLKPAQRVDCARRIVAYATHERTPWPRATPTPTTQNSLTS